MKWINGKDVGVFIILGFCFSKCDLDCGFFESLGEMYYFRRYFRFIGGVFVF